MKRGGGVGGLKRIPADEPMRVRFLQEPDEWFEFFEHYDERNKTYAVCTDDCDYCADDIRAQKRVLASVVVIDENKVEPLAMPSSLVNRLLTRYDKYLTMTDRNYELIRTGKGLDTEYDVDVEAPTRMKLSRYEVLDAAAVLEALAPDDDDEDEEENMTASDRRGSSKKRSRPVEDDDDDEEEDDDEIEEYEPPVKGRKRATAVPDDDEDDEDFLRPTRSKPAVKPRVSPGTGRARPLGKKATTKPVKKRPGGLSK